MPFLCRKWDWSEQRRIWLTYGFVGDNVAADGEAHAGAGADGGWSGSGHQPATAQDPRCLDAQSPGHCFFFFFFLLYPFLSLPSQLLTTCDFIGAQMDRTPAPALTAATRFLV